jgi:hypothetical protein
VLAGYAFGATIRSKDGGALAIPLPAAGRFFGGGGRRKRITPELWEEANNQDLHYVARPGRPPLLVAQRVRLSGARSGAGGLRGGVARQSRRRAGSGTSSLWVPIFVLLREVRVQRRFNLDEVETYIEQRLGENLILELGRRGIV